MVYTANWVIIYHLPPSKGTRNSYWNIAPCLFQKKKCLEDYFPWCGVALCSGVFTAFFCFREVSKFNKLNLHSHFGPWKKSLNFILPTKYVIPKSLKVTLPGWVSSRGLFCFHLGEGNRLMKLAPRENWWLGLIKSPFKIAAHSFIFGGGGGRG